MAGFAKGGAAVRLESETLTSRSYITTSMRKSEASWPQLGQRLVDSTAENSPTNSLRRLERWSETSQMHTIPLEAAIP